jgi:dTDP-4-amino-4,6-dideoxygalactose transaminase
MTDPVIEFENKIAEFYGAPYGVAVDSCTHGIELCLRLTGAKSIQVPHRTYLSIPMLAKKLNIELRWVDANWSKAYYVTKHIIDAAVLWEKDSYLVHTFMCLSFQYKKHLSLGRGGMILCSDKITYDLLKKMSYDGRLSGIPWREQNVETLGYHYYMTPETAQLGLDKLQAAIDTPARIWDVNEWPDLTQMKVFHA